MQWNTVNNYDEACNTTNRHEEHNCNQKHKWNEQNVGHKADNDPWRCKIRNLISCNKMQEQELRRGALFAAFTLVVLGLHGCFGKVWHHSAAMADGGGKAFANGAKFARTGTDLCWKYRGFRIRCFGSFEVVVSWYVSGRVLRTIAFFERQCRRKTDGMYKIDDWIKHRYIIY